MAVDDETSHFSATSYRPQGDSFRRYTTKALAVLLIFCTTAVIQNGCTSLGPKYETPVLSLAPQSTTRYQCGPTTLAAVLAFHGSTVAEQTIAASIYSPTARGVLITDLSHYARQQGFVTKIGTGSMMDLEAAVARGNPPVVLIDLGRGWVRQPHFTAIIGWSETGIAYQDSSPGGKWVSHQTFKRQWQRSGNQYLFISPAP
jgi:hypothetical protein